MVAKKSLTGQLKGIGYKFRFFGRSEIEVLRQLIEPGEFIVQCVYGYYQGGSGLLVATDKRLLLIDKRPFYLYVENHGYESVTQIDFMAHMLQGVLYFQADLKKFVFKSISDARLAKLCRYVQEKIESNVKQIVTSQISSRATSNRRYKPYLNPAWSPHHLTFYPRSRPRKFHTNTTKPVTN